MSKLMNFITKIQVIALYLLSILRFYEELY